MIKATEVLEDQPSSFYLPCLSSIEYQEAPYEKLKQTVMDTLENSAFFSDSKQVLKYQTIKSFSLRKHGNLESNIYIRPSTCRGIP